MTAEEVIKKNKKRILFRADGNNEIGLGHVYRCLAIAERLAEQFDCFLAASNPAPELKETICGRVTLVDLKEYGNNEMEAKDIALSIVSSYQIDIITLDGYSFDTAYQLCIKNNCKAVLISIDDNQPYHYLADIVINHAGGVDAASISKEPYTKLFLGSDYLLLRKEFIEASTRKKEIAGINSALICFGGSDPGDFTGKIVSCIANEASISEITVIVGSAYNKIKNLEKIVNSYSHINIKTNLDAEAIVKLMERTQLAILPSSTISLEALSGNMVIITGLTAQNQSNIYNGLTREETVYGIGDFNNLSCTDLLAIIKEATLKFKNYIFLPKKKTADPVVDIYNLIK